MLALVKRSAERLPGAEVAFVRFVVGLAIVLLVATRRQLRARNWVGLGLRGLFGGSSVTTQFLVVAHLPVGVATLLSYVAPLFTLPYAALFLGERLRGRAVGALTVATLGTVLVVAGDKHPAGTLGFGPWHLLGLLSAMLSGAAVATIREARRTDGAWEVFAAFCVGGTLMTVVPACVHWVAPTLGEWAALIAMGLVSVAAQVLISDAFKHVEAGLGGVILQLTPVAAIVLGCVLFGERAQGVVLAGAALTLAGVSWGACEAAVPPSPRGDA